MVSYHDYEENSESYLHFSLIYGFSTLRYIIEGIILLWSTNERSLKMHCNVENAWRAREGHSGNSGSCYVTKREPMLQVLPRRWRWRCRRVV